MNATSDVKTSYTENLTSEPKQPVPVLAGIDWLQVTTHNLLCTDVLADIRKARDAAHDEHVDVMLEIEGVSFAVKPYGNGVFPAMLVCGDFVLYTRWERAKLKDMPAMMIVMRSEWLWDEDWSTAFADLLWWLEKVCGEKIEYKISRVDLTVDVQNFAPCVQDFENFRTQSRISSAVYRSGQEVTGFRFGGGDITLRIYDKVREIYEASQKWWFFDKWKAGEEQTGYRQFTEKEGTNSQKRFAQVTRIEFQLRREALKTFVMGNAVDGVTTVDDLVECWAPLWRYLCGEGIGGKGGRGWINLKIPDPNDANVSRWRVDDRWVAIRDVMFRKDVFDIGRVGRKRTPRKLRDAQALTPGLAGYASSVAALLALHGGEETTDAKEEQVKNFSTALAIDGFADKLGSLIRELFKNGEKIEDVARRMCEAGYLNIEKVEGAFRALIAGSDVHERAPGKARRRGTFRPFGERDLQREILEKVEREAYARGLDEGLRATMTRVE